MSDADFTFPKLLFLSFQYFFLKIGPRTPCYLCLAGIPDEPWNDRSHRRNCAQRNAGQLQSFPGKRHFLIVFFKQWKIHVFVFRTLQRSVPQVRVPPEAVAKSRARVLLRGRGLHTGGRNRQQRIKQVQLLHLRLRPLSAVCPETGG